MDRKYWYYLGVLILLVSAVCLVGCGAEPEPTEAPPTAVPQEDVSPTEEVVAEAELNCEGYGEGGKCRVVLVNSFLGNDYRIQMQRAAEAAAKYEPYTDIIDFEILNTENTPEAQRAGVENLLAEGVDAILLNAVDNTSMNDLVEKACDMDVKVAHKALGIQMWRKLATTLESFDVALQRRNQTLCFQDNGTQLKKNQSCFLHCPAG